jgi:hypothetical protein
MESRTTKGPTLRAAAADFARELDVRGRAKAHPYGAVAAAIGLGYVLGGGLFTRLTARLLKAGVRVGADLATVPLLMKAADTLAKESPCMRIDKR